MDAEIVTFTFVFLVTKVKHFDSSKYFSAKTQFRVGMTVQITDDPEIYRKAYESIGYLANGRSPDGQKEFPIFRRDTMNKELMK